MPELEAIRARHRPLYIGKAPYVEGPPLRTCIAEPLSPWPCDTARVLARLDAAEAREKALREAVMDPRRYTRTARCGVHGSPHMVLHGSEEHHRSTPCDLCAVLAEPPGDGS